MNTKKRDKSKPLDTEIAAYDAMRERLEQECFGKYVLIYGEELSGTYESFPDAAHAAVTKYGRGPYLIREVGATAVISLPTVFRSWPLDAHH